MFVLLNFCPKILEKEDARMREITDRHFPDNWIIPIFQGYLVDLTIYWNDFVAAKKAMANNIYLENIRKIAALYYKRMKKCQEQLKHYLIEGKLLEEYVLDHVKSLMKLLRDVNVTIRWVMLHKTTKNRQIYEILDKGFTGEEVVDLILKTSKFEQIFKNMLQNLVSEKVNIWEADKGNSYAYILEISEYF